MSDEFALGIIVASVLALGARLIMFGGRLSRHIPETVVWCSPTEPSTWKARALIVAQYGVVLAVVAFHLLFPDNAFSKWIATPTGIGVSITVYVLLLWIAGIAFGMRYLRYAKRA